MENYACFTGSSYQYLFWLQWASATDGQNKVFEIVTHLVTHSKNFEMVFDLPHLYPNQFRNHGNHKRIGRYDIQYTHTAFILPFYSLYTVFCLKVAFIVD